MSSTINATTVGVGGVVTTADNSGILVLQTASTTALTISAAQGVTLAGTLGVTGITTVAAGTAALPSIISTTGTADTGQFFPAADTIAYSTAGTERVRIDSSGNVGIGTTAPVSVGGYGALTLNGTTGSLVYLQTNATSAMQIATNSSGASITAIGASLPLYFSTNSIERMRIDSSGNVGIGTTAPLSQLDVSIAITSPTLGEATGVGAIRITNGTSSLTSAGGLEFKNAGDSNGYGAKIQSLNSGGAQLVFANRNGSATWTERMRISSGGDVGIGTATPFYKLHISGSLLQSNDWAVIGAYNAGGGYPTPTDVAVAFAWNFTAGGRDVTMMNNDYSGQGVRFVQRTAAATSSYVGRGAQTGDWFQGNNSASWSTVSDIRIKQNVRPLNDSLAKITALNPCHFEYKNTPEKIKTGFIAQEFEQILPGHVQESEPDVLFSEYFDLEAGEKMKSIDPDLIPYLVGAIKELKAIIDTQAARITALETE